MSQQVHMAWHQLALREEHTGQGHAQWTFKLSNLEFVLMDVCRRDSLSNTRCLKFPGHPANCMAADNLTIMRQHSLTVDAHTQPTLTANSLHQYITIVIYTCLKQAPSDSAIIRLESGGLVRDK